jgi:hypothetical protein
MRSVGFQILRNSALRFSAMGTSDSHALGVLLFRINIDGNGRPYRSDLAR